MVERAYRAVRAFILERVNPLLPLYEGGGVSMPALEAEDIAFGALDAVRQRGRTLCSVWPESMEDAEDDIDGRDAVLVSARVAFYCRGADYAELAPRASRYASCFKRAVEADWTLSGKAQSARVARAEFQWDCGPAERQAAGCEIEMEITMVAEEE